MTYQDLYDELEMILAETRADQNWLLEMGDTTESTHDYFNGRISRIREAQERLFRLEELES
jgi:hypothetical protein